jgi:hypothetical protein
MVVAGGGAAWHLERRLETLRGNDAFPLVTRSNTILPVGRGGRGYLWVPSNIDVFVHASDSSTVHVLVRQCYETFLNDMFGRVGEELVGCRHTSTQSSPAGTQEMRRDVVACLVRDFHLDERLCMECRAHDYAMDVTSRVEEVYEYRCFHQEPLVSSALNVMHTTAPPEGTAFAEWVVGGFDLAHCAVVMDVDPFTGMWTFEGSRRSCRALMHRRLHLLPGCFSDTLKCVVHVERLCKYSFWGFTHEGDAHWPNADEEDTMMLHSFHAWD